MEAICDGYVVLYDARICPLHKVGMTRTEVAIKYRLSTNAFLVA